MTFTALYANKDYGLSSFSNHLYDCFNKRTNVICDVSKHQMILSAIVQPKMNRFRQIITDLGGRGKVAVSWVISKGKSKLSPAGARWPTVHILRFCSEIIYIP